MNAATNRRTENSARHLVIERRQYVSLRERGMGFDAA
jgi:hypothetical protein|tara:strand:+ start:507 stop:617 length:111 start_codon:yes stop_codon:yes gene_type:complete